MYIFLFVLCFHAVIMSLGLYFAPFSGIPYFATQTCTFWNLPLTGRERFLVV